VGIESVPGNGVVEGKCLKVVWGDATDYDDVLEAVRGVDWVLDAMAFISPAADYCPEIARAVNTDAIVNIVRAIEAQPDGAEHIKLIYTGTVVETGDRDGEANVTSLVVRFGIERVVQEMGTVLLHARRS
jgi:hypothetical protein